jgi:hypothetical protein
MQRGERVRKRSRFWWIIIGIVVVCTLAVGSCFGGVVALFTCCGQAHPNPPEVVRESFLEGFRIGALIGGAAGVVIAAAVAVIRLAWPRR